MYESYWDLTAAPFQNVPDPRFFCRRQSGDDLLEKLLYVARHGKGGAVVTGDEGSGKSMLGRIFLLELEEDRYEVGLVVNPSMPADELLGEVAVQLGVAPASPQRSALLRAINEQFVKNAQAGRMTVLLVDEAHTVTDEAVFDDLRMLLNFQLNDRQLVALILLGTPALRESLARHPALLERLPLRLHLPSLSPAESAAYIEFRLQKAGATRPIFTAEAVQALVEASGGIPRRINNLADLCLFDGWKRRVRAVDSSIVTAAQQALQQVPGDSGG